MTKSTSEIGFAEPRGLSIRQFADPDVDKIQRDRTERTCSSCIVEAHSVHVARLQCDMHLQVLWLDTMPVGYATDGEY